MHNYLVAGIDWTPQWVRCLVCSDQGVELNRAIWPRDEVQDHLLAFVQSERAAYGIPLLVTGRCRAPWPDQFLSQLTLAGFSYDLFDGPPLGSMLRLERRYREDMAYRPAALLAAIHISRPHLTDWREFVLRWSVGQARQRLDELAGELQSDYPEDSTDADCPQTQRLVTFAHAFSVRPRRPDILEKQTTLF